MKKILKKMGFWPKNEVEKAEEMLQLYMKFIPKLRKIQNEGYDVDNPEQIEKSMYDFYAGLNGNIADNDGMWDQGITLNSMISVTDAGDQRKVAKPVDVLKELETVPTPFNTENLDEKIKLFKDKSKLTNQRYTKDQIDGFIKRLENRKKYKDVYHFFNKFPNTTDEKIDDLLSKYKLVMKKSHLFVPTFPKEAIDVMKEYTEHVKKVTNEKPVFYVIAEEKDFTKKEKKLDPILLAQSPFGFYHQILGAWDKEMLLLHEL